jgi:hypothetical protein
VCDAHPCSCTPLRSGVDGPTINVVIDRRYRPDHIRKGYEQVVREVLSMPVETWDDES